MPDNQIPPPEQPELPSWAEDSRAKKEERYFPDEPKLQGQRRKNDLLWLKIYGGVVVCLMLVLTLLFLSSLLAWTWHYVAPVCWHWLTPSQLEKIQSVIFSGSLGGIVSFIAQKQLSK